METTLIVQAELLDPTLIAKHLQLKGSVQDAAWRFKMADRLRKESLSSHIHYWRSLLSKHNQGARALQQIGYSFSISIKLTDENFSLLSLSSDEIKVFSRYHLGLTIEFFNDKTQVIPTTRDDPTLAP